VNDVITKELLFNFIFQKYALSLKIFTRFHCCVQLLRTVKKSVFELKVFGVKHTKKLYGFPPNLFSCHPYQLMQYQAYGGHLNK